MPPQQPDVVAYILQALGKIQEQQAAAREDMAAIKVQLAALQAPRKGIPPVLLVMITVLISYLGPPLFSLAVSTIAGAGHPVVAAAPVTPAPAAVPSPTGKQALASTSPVP